MASNLSIALMIGASVGGAMAGIKRLQNTLNTLRDNTLNTTAKLKSLAGTTALGLTGTISGIKATSGIVMNLAEPAIKFESAMADVKKVVDFKSPEGFANLSKDLLNLTRILPMTAEELAAITASGGQLGVAEEDLKDFTTTIAKMSVAFDMSAEASGDAMAKLANVYKIPIKDIGNLGDAINELSNSSPAKASDIVTTLGRIGGVAKQFGLTENAAAALSNSFISLGKAPEVAGTAINGMLTKLMTADKGGKKFQAALKSMGLEATGLKKTIEKDAQGALTGFLKQIQKLPKEKQMGALVDLFGLEYADDVAVLAGNVDVLENSLRTLQETDENGKAKYLGSMEKEFSARAATTENGLQLLKNSITEFGTVLGAKLLPVINNVAGKLGEMMHWVTDLMAQNSWLADTLLYLGGAVAGVFTGFSTLTAVIGGLSMSWVVMSKPIFKTIGFIRMLLGWGRQLITLFAILGVKVLDMAITFGKSILMMSRALLTNPIGLIITGIAVAAYLIYQYWEPIKAFFAGLWDWVEVKFEGAWNWISGIWSQAGTWFSGIWEQIKGFFNSGIGNITATILNWSPLGLFYQAFAGVLSWFGIELPSKFSEFGGNLISGLVNGIKEKWEVAKEWVVGLGKSIKGWFTTETEIHSPSRVFKGYGVNIVEGLALGVDKAQSLAKDAMTHVADKMITAMPATIQAPKLADGGIAAGVAELMGKTQADLDKAAVAMTKRRQQLLGESEPTKKRASRPKVRSISTTFRDTVAPITQAATLNLPKPESKGFWGGLWDKVKGLGNTVAGWFKGMDWGKTLNFGSQLLLGKPLKLPQADWRTPAFNPHAEQPEYQSLQQRFKERQAQQSQSTNIQGGITVHFNPTINVNSNQSQGVLELVQQGLAESLVEFERLFNRMVDQRQRRAY